MQSELLMEIPIDINHVMFKYFQIYCDTWNKQYSNQKAEIDLNIVSSKDKKKNIVTVYGNHILQFGDYYEWRIKITKKIRYAFIGLIHDDQAYLRALRANWNWARKGFVYDGYRWHVLSPSSQ